MRKQVGYRDKMGDEQFYFLEFNEETSRFYLVTEYISPTGEERTLRRLLEDSVGDRGHSSAVSYIRDKLFPENSS